MIDYFNDGVFIDDKLFMNNAADRALFSIYEYKKKTGRKIGQKGNDNDYCYGKGDEYGCGGIGSRDFFVKMGTGHGYGYGFGNNSFNLLSSFALNRIYLRNLNLNMNETKMKNETPN